MLSDFQSLFSKMKFYCPYDRKLKRKEREDNCLGKTTLYISGCVAAESRGCFSFSPGGGSTRDVTQVTEKGLSMRSCPQMAQCTHRACSQGRACCMLICNMLLHGDQQQGFYVEGGSRWLNDLLAGLGCLWHFIKWLDACERFWGVAPLAHTGGHLTSDCGGQRTPWKPSGQDMAKWLLGLVQHGLGPGAQLNNGVFPQDSSHLTCNLTRAISEENQCFCRT